MAIRPSPSPMQDLVDDNKKVNPAWFKWLDYFRQAASSTVTAAGGGTGFSSYAVGDVLYADTTTTLAKLPDVATGNALITGGVGVAPSYGKIGLTTHVSGLLPVANGGTGTSNVPVSTPQSIAYAASITPNAALGERVVVGALTGAIAVNAPASPLVGQMLILSFTQDGTGLRQITYNAAFKTTLVPGVGTAGQKASQTFVYDGTNWVQSGGALTWF